VGKATLRLMGKEEDTGQAPGTASYDDNPFLPEYGDVKIDGTSVDCMGKAINIDIPADEIIPLGNTVLAKEPKLNGHMVVTGNFEALFDALTDYNKFAAHTTVDIAYIWTGAGTDALTINMNKVKLQQATPHNDGSRERLTNSFVFYALQDGTHSGDENLEVILVSDASQA
jgi:hypothetical protein